MMGQFKVRTITRNQIKKSTCENKLKELIVAIKDKLIDSPGPISP